MIFFSLPFPELTAKSTTLFQRPFPIKELMGSFKNAFTLRYAHNSPEQKRSLISFDFYMET